MIKMDELLQKYQKKDIANELKSGKLAIREPDGVELYVERKLPFLVVYRPTKGDVDQVIANMARNEASYFICPSDAYADWKPVLHDLIKFLSDEFGALLLMEIWTDQEAVSTQDNLANFELFGPGDYLPESVKPLLNHMEEIDLAGMVPKMKLNIEDQRSPKGLEPALERKELKQLECLLLGLKVESFYRDRETGQIYPVLERQLYSQFSALFKKSVFDFVKVQSNHKLSGFQSLARREITPVTWEIDKQLMEIDKQFNFLMLVSPINTHTAWKEFKESRFQETPVFHYRMLPNDPELLKRELYNIQIEKIDDPTLGFLFRDKRAEVDKMLTMLNERDTPDFLYGSLQVFGGVSGSLLESAKEILDEFPRDLTNSQLSGDYYTAAEFADMAHQELLYMKKQWAGVNTDVEIKDTITDLMVDKGVLNIPAKSKIPRERVEALLQHELGTHVLTYYNGKSQPLKLLSSGIPGYEQLQEGIAVLSEYLTGGLTVERMQLLAARVVAVDSMVNERDFRKTFELLTDQYHFKSKRAFRITTRVYRGGGFTKDAVYLNGLIQLIKYLKEGNPLEPLLIGKIRQNYLPVVNELVEREILKPIKIKPRYLYNNEALKRLSELKGIKNITQLIN